MQLEANSVEIVWDIIILLFVARRPRNKKKGRLNKRIRLVNEECKDNHHTFTLHDKYPEQTSINVTVNKILVKRTLIQVPDAMCF